MKYWIDKNGKPTETGQHYEIASRLLAKLGVKLQHKRNTKQERGSLMYQTDYDSAYEEMFKLGYARVNEQDAIVYVEIPGVSKIAYLPRGQRHFLEDKTMQGKEISLNAGRFVKTRTGRSNADEIVRKLVAG